MLYPAGNRGANPAAAAATVTVTLPSGQTVTGKLAYRDELVIGLTDSSGRYRSWSKSRVKLAVNNQIQAHIEQLGKYTDDAMHNVLAYLQTLHEANSCRSWSRCYGVCRFCEEAFQKMKLGCYGCRLAVVLIALFAFQGPALTQALNPATLLDPPVDSSPPYHCPYSHHHHTPLPPITLATYLT